MRTLKIYQIDLKNLSPAKTYEFDYVLDNEFFENVNGPEVKEGKVNVSLSVVRISSAFELDFRIEGVVTVTCDRCLDDMEIPVETINRLIITFGEMYAETSDEQIIISEEEGFINIAWYMYEFIALAIPMKHVHKPGECNEVMASKLNELCVDESEVDDEEVPESEDDIQPVDPRWNVLRNLIGDN
ncbi:MAG: DUF177 domain-containing protein [Tannerella sp.]|nr:DUF177 domain-containing protein [Tannerella sp.]